MKLGRFMTQSCNDGYEMYTKAWCSTCKVVFFLFLPFSFLSPSSLLTLPVVVIQKFATMVT